VYILHSFIRLDINLFAHSELFETPKLSLLYYQNLYFLF